MRALPDFYGEWHDPLVGHYPTIDDYGRALKVIHDEERPARSVTVQTPPVGGIIVSSEDCPIFPVEKSSLRSHTAGNYPSPRLRKFWISRLGTGVRDADGKPLLFDTIADADSHIASHHWQHATVYRLAEAYDSAWTLEERT